MRTSGSTNECSELERRRQNTNNEIHFLPDFLTGALLSVGHEHTLARQVGDEMLNRCGKSLLSLP